MPGTYMLPLYAPLLLDQLPDFFKYNQCMQMHMHKKSRNVSVQNIENIQVRK